MFKRKILLINPKFQLSFLFFMLLMALLVVGVNVAANEIFFAKFKELGSSLGLPVDHVFFTFIAEQKSTMQRILFFSSLACFSIITLGGLILSHRVAGPMYRLKKHLDEQAHFSELKEVKFRNKDYFQEVADAYNRLLKKSSPK